MIADGRSTSNPESVMAELIGYLVALVHTKIPSGVRDRLQLSTFSQ